MSLSMVFIREMDEKCAEALKVLFRTGLSVSNVFFEQTESYREAIIPEGVSREDFQRWLWLQVTIEEVNPSSDGKALAEQVRIAANEMPELVLYVCGLLANRRAVLTQCV